MRMCLHSFACVQYCLLFHIANGGEYTIRTQQNIPELTQQTRTVTTMTTRQTDTIVQSSTCVQHSNCVARWSVHELQSLRDIDAPQVKMLSCQNVNAKYKTFVMKAIKMEVKSIYDNFAIRYFVNITMVPYYIPEFLDD